jgi:hypothetical protein
VIWSVIESAPAVNVPGPVAGAQKPPLPLDVALAQWTVKVEAKLAVPNGVPVAVPLKPSLHSFVPVSWHPAGERLVIVPVVAAFSEKVSAFELTDKPATSKPAQDTAKTTARAANPRPPTRVLPR